MSFKAYLNLGMSFLELRPTIGQILNTARYARHYFGNSFTPRVTHSPLSIGVYITYSCNLHCPYCWNPAINKKDYTKENMSLEEFGRILDAPGLRNAFRVSYVGGEPLLHPDLFKMIEMALVKKKLSMFPSNGLLIERRLEDFRRSRLHSIQISLYDGYVDEQIRNAALLRKVNPRVEMALARYVTTQPESLEYMHEVVKMAESLNIKNICFQNFQPAPGTDPGLSIYDDNGEVLEWLAGFERRYAKRFNIMLPAPLLRDRAKRFCYDLYTVVFVGKGGIIAPCSSIVPPDAKFGNIWEPDFWNNKYFDSHRRMYNSQFPFNPVCEHCYESSLHIRNFI